MACAGTAQLFKGLLFIIHDRFSGLGITLGAARQLSLGSAVEHRQHQAD